MSTTIEVENLGKYFGSIKAVDDISFSVKKGEVLGFLGPNGAGKSTTMKMLTCFITPTFGTSRIFGHDILESSMEVRQKLGYLPESAPAYEDMDVQSFLAFISEVRGIESSKRQSNLDRVYDLVGIKNVRHQTIGTLSKGYKRRVGLGQAILHDPAILILDEPTDGLDPNQKYEVRKLIQKMAKDKVIILSTHILEEVDAVCTRAIIIAKGKIVADGTPESLRKKSVHFGMVKLILKGNVSDASYKLFKGATWAHKVEKINGDQDLVSLLIYPEKNQEILPKVIDSCLKQNWEIKEISVDPGHLAEVFRKATK